MAGMYAERTAYNIGEAVRGWFRSLLELFFQAAGLAVDTLRTFFLIVLALLGPLAFAISVYDGFQSTLTAWIARYVGISLWLPVSDLFGAMLSRLQTLMLSQDIEQLRDPDFIPDGSNTVYCIFLIIGIVGYFFIPTVASWIIQSGGGGMYQHRINAGASALSGYIAGTAGAAAGNAAGHTRNIAHPQSYNHGVQDTDQYPERVRPHTTRRRARPGR